MHALSILLVLTLNGAAEGTAGPCAAGVKVADDCFEVTDAGCCTAGNAVRWCEGGVLCELSCAGKPACGWKVGTGAYDCGTQPKGDPSCTKPYSCFVGGCAATWEQKGCCGCPCEECVCGKDPYCCSNKWDPVCVDECRQCGGCGSPDGCTPAPTPGCGGCACETCVCVLDGFCCEDKWDSLCAQLCEVECEGGCQVCQPDCTGKLCGDDGCLGKCGVCPAGYECSAEFKCQKKCIPSCAGKDCGSNGCWGSCGTCKAGYECNALGKCYQKPCEPQCEGKVCGDDGCGGSCGKCGEEELCLAGQCVGGLCIPQCDGKECGNDGCGWFCGLCPPDFMCNEMIGKCQKYCKFNCDKKECGDDGCGGSCGECAAGLQCAQWTDELGETYWTCKAPCFPNCTGKECGPDVCGGSCGKCPAEKPNCATIAGICTVEPCVPSCGGKECGDDGCGGTCATCPMSWHCEPDAFMCVPICTPQCLVPPMYLEPKQCGWDECPGSNVCGVCPAGSYCGQGYVCVEDTCSCAGKQCGIPQPGCKNECGVCPAPLTCDMEIAIDPETNICETCTPTCIGPDGLVKECGGDGCGGPCPGTCPLGYKCDEDPNDGDGILFKCEPCVKQCEGKMCGDDGCGGTCGECPPGTLCNEVKFQCEVCPTSCMTPPENLWPMECGPNACPAGCMDAGLKPCKTSAECDVGTQCNAMTGQCVACGSCGTCPLGYVCDGTKEDDPEIYVCQPCKPNCDKKECGDNGCGGSCGICPPDTPCTEVPGGGKACIKPCDPTAGCLNKMCGPNSCPAGCMAMGQDACGEWGVCPEGLICDPKQNKCVPCTGSCGACPEGEYCGPDYMCQVIQDPCYGKECGDNGEGGSCGTCAEGLVCEAGKCVSVEPEVVEAAEVVSDGGGEEAAEVVVPDTQDVKPELGPVTCPPGYKKLFNKCVPDTPVEDDGGGGGGCGCMVDGRGQVPTVLLSVLMLALLAGMRRVWRRGEGA